MTWETTYPTDHIAIIYLFSGEVVKRRVCSLHTFNGNYERVHTVDERGQKYKTKFDEEPFMVVAPFRSDSRLIEKILAEAE